MKKILFAYLAVFFVCLGVVLTLIFVKIPENYFVLATMAGVICGSLLGHCVVAIPYLLIKGEVL